jgi:Lrp/AsnC family leucine-responsive transcriptional regulator
MSPAHARAEATTGLTSRKRLDDFDRRILDILSTNARISNAELARHIGLSPAPCLRRVQALERAGIIQSYVARVDTAALNLVIAIVRIRFHYENRQLRFPFEQSLLKIPEIRHLSRTNGDSDYLVVVEAPSLTALDRLLVDSLLSHPGVKGLQSAIRLRNCFRTSKLVGVILVPGASD